MTPDEQIQQLLSTDDPRTLDMIYDVYGSNLFGYLSCLICCKQDTEDSFQNLFITIAKKRHLLRHKKNLKAYLMVMAKNEAMAFFRQKKKDINTVQCDEAFLFSGPTESPVPEEDLSRALAQLPLEQREVITLKIYQGMTFEEIGTHLNVSPNTAASRYKYGLKKMKNEMSQVV